jgi:hypothetical protein
MLFLESLDMLCVRPEQGLAEPTLKLAEKKSSSRGVLKMWEKKCMKLLKLYLNES